MEETCQEPPVKVARFASVSDDDLVELVRDRVPQTTRRTTEKWVRIIHMYLSAKNITCDDFSSVKSEDLGHILVRL